MQATTATDDQDETLTLAQRLTRATKTAREAISKKSPFAFGELGGGFNVLSYVLDAIESLPLSAPTYKRTDLLKKVDYARNTAASEASLARSRLTEAQSSLRELAQVPAVGGPAEALIDIEVRTVVRAMRSEQRSTLMAEIKKGQHGRTLLALARSPLVLSDLESAAAVLYETSSHPKKREFLSQQRDSEVAGLAEAAVLKGAAVATQTALQLSIEAAAEVRRD